MFCTNLKLKGIAHCMLISPFLEKFVRRNSLTFKGPGRKVEIDETLFTQRKYNKGTPIEKQWCFKGIERGSNRSFVVSLERRGATTLLPLIVRHIFPETTMVSDQ